MSNMQGLSHTDITTLLGKSRSRNNYGPKLEAFVNSDEAAIDVQSVWAPELGEKSASTLYQGFLSAAKKATPPLAAPVGPIMVKQHDDHVYLLHKDRVAILAQQATDAD